MQQLSSSLKTLPLTSIILPENRQRKELKTVAIQELKKSIMARGLFHPILLSHNVASNEFRLCAGRTRFAAVQQLFEEGHAIRCHQTEIPLGEIPFTLLDQLPADEIAEAELDENVIRTDLSWDEKVQARAAIFELRKARELKEGRIATISSVGKELAAKAGEEFNSTHRDQISRALQIAPFLKDPRIANAPNEKEAFRRVMDRRASELKVQLALMTPRTESGQVLQGNCLEVMKTLPLSTFDTILVDPPYGIDANKMKKTEKHFYEDEANYALSICKGIIQQGFQLLKARGILFMFCDIDHFILLREFSKAQGYTAWRTPIIWSKQHHGSAPWGKEGFLRSYEILLFLSKGAKGLVNAGSDVLDIQKIGKGEKLHAAEKPEELLTYLLSCSSLPGDSILDPCCGSGSIIPVARKMKLNFTCIELDPEYHALALGRLSDQLEEPELDLATTQ